MCACACVPAGSLGWSAGGCGRAAPPGSSSPGPAHPPPPGSSGALRAAAAGSGSPWTPRPAAPGGGERGERRGMRTTRRAGETVGNMRSDQGDVVSTVLTFVLSRTKPYKVQSSFNTKLLIMSSSLDFPPEKADGRK